MAQGSISGRKRISLRICVLKGKSSRYSRVMMAVSLFAAVKLTDCVNVRSSLLLSFLFRGFAKSKAWYNGCLPLGEIVVARDGSCECRCALRCRRDIVLASAIIHLLILAHSTTTFLAWCRSLLTGLAALPVLTTGCGRLRRPRIGDLGHLSPRCVIVLVTRNLRYVARWSLFHLIIARRQRLLLGARGRWWYFVLGHWPGVGRS